MSHWSRLRSRDDETPNAPPVALLSEHMWRNRFGATSDVVGKVIKLDGKQITIIGVLEEGVRIPSFLKDPVDVWVPLPAKGFLSGPVVGRLAVGVTMTSAEQELRNIAKGLTQSEASLNGTQFEISLRSPGSSGKTRISVLMLAGAVCLLLLIACANVAHLLLARGTARERELAVRAALGAGRGRIVRQLVTESLMLSLAGCLAGLGVGALSLRAIITLRPANMEELTNAHIDLRVLLATIALSILIGTLFGLIAGFSGRAGRSFEVLRSSVASTTDRLRNRLRSLLVVTENALSVVLLIGAVLLIRTVINLYQIDPGFDASNLYAMSVDLPEARYGTNASRQLYADQLLAAARLVPGVQEATIASSAPSRTGVMIGDWIGEAGRAASDKDDIGFTAMNTVRPEYFSFIRMPLASGRTFSENATQNHEVIVSQSMARKLWGDTNVVGRRLRVDSKQTSGTGPELWNVVAGVAPDAALLSLTDRGETPSIYFPMSKVPERHLTLIVRLRESVVPVLEFRRLFLSVDNSISPPEIVSVTESLFRSVASQRFLMALLTLFALLAISLSAIGLYGVITYMVSQSTREIGVRVALGAARRDVIRLVMRKGVTLSLLGLGIGVVASIWGTRLLTHMLYGVTPMDSFSFLTGSLLLLLIAVAACVAPTMRAIRIDPMLAMRSE